MNAHRLKIHICYNNYVQVISDMEKDFELTHRQ